jgi:hypothetical protein
MRCKHLNRVTRSFVSLELLLALRADIIGDPFAVLNDVAKVTCGIRIQPRDLARCLRVFVDSLRAQAEVAQCGQADC